MKTPADLSDEDALIAALLERIEALVAGTARLAARVICFPGDHVRKA